MPFGKYKGTPVGDLPDNYLQWLFENCELREPLLSAVTIECGRRFAERTVPTGKPNPSLARQVIDNGFRVLALKHHPDHGGDTPTMQALNVTVEWLRQQVEVLT